MAAKAIMKATTNSTSIAVIPRRRLTPAAREIGMREPRFRCAGSQPEAAGLAPAALRDRQVIGWPRHRSEGFPSSVLLDEAGWHGYGAVDFPRDR